MLSANLMDVLDRARQQLLNEPNRPVHLTYDLDNKVFGVNFRGAPPPPADLEHKHRPVYLTQLTMESLDKALAGTELTRLVTALVEYAFIVDLAARPLTLLDIHDLGAAADTLDTRAPQPTTPPEGDTLAPGEVERSMREEEAEDAALESPAHDIAPENLDDVQPEPLG